MDDNLKNGPRRSTTEMNEICVLSSLKPAGSEDSLHGVSRSNTCTHAHMRALYLFSVCVCVFVGVYVCVCIDA